MIPILPAVAQASSLLFATHVAQASCLPNSPPYLSPPFQGGDAGVSSILFFAGVLLAIGFGICYFSAGLRQRTLSCHCGREQTHNALTLTDTDAAEITARLTALCPVCRAQGRDIVPTNQRGRNHDC